MGLLPPQASWPLVSAQLSFSHSPYCECTSKLNPKTSHQTSGSESSDGMFPEKGPWKNVLVSTRPRSGAAAAPLVIRC